MMALISRPAPAVLVMIGSLWLSACVASGGAPQSQNLAQGTDLDLSGYDRVMIDPVTVEFDKAWRPVQAGSHLEMSRKDRERLQRDVAAVFDQSFREEIERGGALEVVDRPGPGVLRITPELIDVQLNAPTPMAQPGTTFTRSVGHATLHLVFREADSGEQVLELHDYVRGRDIGLLRPASPVYNRVELTRIFKDWAQVVREDLFRAP